MNWSMLLGALVLLVGIYVFATRNRSRVSAVVTIPVTSSPTVQIDPPDAQAEELLHLVLCYASKVRWLVLSEPAAIQEVFRQLCREAADSWDKPGTDLIDRMPSGATCRNERTDAKAASGGEDYKIALFRTDYTNLENRCWVTNSLPRASLAVNPPWSVVVLLNAVFVLLNGGDREWLRRSWATWCAEALAAGSVDSSASGLKTLFRVSVKSVANARHAAPNDSA